MVVSSSSLAGVSSVRVAARKPGSRLAAWSGKGQVEDQRQKPFAEAGHLPHITHPAEFVAKVSEFTAANHVAVGTEVPTARVARLSQLVS